MSPAEQITPVQELAKHAVHKSYWDKWVCICGGWEHRDDNYGDILTVETRELHAAHVVAALTNAGKAIVELPEPDRVFDGDLPEYDVADDGMVHVTEEPGGRVVVWHQHAEIRDPDAVSVAILAAGLAAARVAEGGERSE